MGQTDGYHDVTVGNSLREHAVGSFRQTLPALSTSRPLARGCPPVRGICFGTMFTRRRLGSILARSAMLQTSSRWRLGLGAEVVRAGLRVELRASDVAAYVLPGAFLAIGLDGLSY
jgi:hypothetical protein